MKKKPRETPNWLLIGLGFACIFAGLLSYLAGQPVVYYYTLLSLAVALLIAALVELRLDALDRKLDEILDRQRKPTIPTNPSATGDLQPQETKIEPKT